MPATERLIGFEQAGIGSLLSQNLLRVPPNQREYAWTDLEVEQLFTDIARAIGEDADYFLGTIVTIPRPSGLLEVVDGQQRLATTAILLSAIRLYMKRIGEDVLEEAISNSFLTGIDRAKRARVPKVTLNSSDHELFRAIVTHAGEGELPEPSLDSHRLLLAAYQQAQAHVERVVAPFNPHDHGDRLNAWVTFLESRARVVLLKVPDDSDAYRMFETLNDRGLRTSQADLIKNYLFGRAGERIDEVQSRWAFMRGTLETIGEDDLTVTFLRHALIVQHGYRRETEVYSTVQDTVRSEDAAAKFASDLDRLAGYYAATFNPEHENWNGHPPADTASNTSPQYVQHSTAQAHHPRCCSPNGGRQRDSGRFAVPTVTWRAPSYRFVDQERRSRSPPGQRSALNLAGRYFDGKWPQDCPQANHSE